MSLWFPLNINDERIGVAEITRREFLDLTDRAAIANQVCTYLVRINDVDHGTVRHRYGDGAWALARAALATAFPSDQTRRLADLRQHLDQAERGAATHAPITELRELLGWPRPR